MIVDCRLKDKDISLDRIYGIVRIIIVVFFPFSDEKEKDNRFQREGMGFGYSRREYLSKTSAGKSNFFMRSSRAYDKISVFLPWDLMGYDLWVSGS